MTVPTIGVTSVCDGARPVTASQVTDAVLAGSWVIDLRERVPYAADAASHTTVGWFVPRDDDVVLLVDSPGITAPDLDDLARIGFDVARAHVVPEPPTASLRRADWAAFREARALSAATGGPEPVVIDVRPHDDWLDGHLPGALHLAVHEVETAGDRVPPGELWVHCRSGHRAGIAASLLHRAGRDVVHVDDAWERVGELHIPVTAAAA